MRIVLTGGNGMVGRNLLAVPAASRHEWLAPARSELDLLDATAVRRYLAQHRPDCIIHAAGTVGGIAANMAQPVRFLVDNWQIGQNVLLAAHELGGVRVLNLGSSCMYPRHAANPLTESLLLSGELEPTNEGYALAKLSVAKLGEYLNREAGAALVKTLLPCNLYGRHDHFDPLRSHLIAAVLLKLHAAKVRGESSVSIWGDGLARREFMFASDFADIVLHALEAFDSLPDYMNIGVGTDHTINDYYACAARIVGYDGTFEHDLTRPVGMRQKLVCVARMQAQGWAATTSLELGMQQTYQFFLETHPAAGGQA